MDVAIAKAGGAAGRNNRLAAQDLIRAFVGVQAGDEAERNCRGENEPGRGRVSSGSILGMAVGESNYASVCRPSI